jgi:cobalt-zinc-cadmium efflux system outer membrane protein
LAPRKTTALVLLLMLALPAGNLPAEQPEGLSLPDLERIARENNPLMQIARLRVDAAEGRRVQVELYPNTQVGYHATEVGNLDTAGAQGFFLRQQFPRQVKRKLDMAVADQAIERSRFDARSMEGRVITDVRLRFYEAMVARSQVKLATELVQISEQATVASKTLLEAERVGENVLLLAELELEKIRIVLDNSGNQQYEAWRRLCASVGVDDLDVNTLVGSIEVLPLSMAWQEIHGVVMAESPELAAAHASVAEWKLAVERAEKEIKPDLDVMLSLRHHNVTSHDIANILVGFPIPFLNRNQGNIQAARANWTAAKQRVRQVELRLTDQMATTYRQYASARQQVERYQQQLIPRADRSITLVQQGYENGQVDYLTLLSTQRTFFQIRLEYLKSLSQLHRNAILLKGLMLSGSLQQR